MVQNLIERCLQLYMTQVGCRGLLQRAAACCFVLQKGVVQHVLPSTAPCQRSVPCFASQHNALPFPAPPFTPCPALPCPALLPCLQNEVVSILQQQAKIEPGFTQLVWQKLEEQNPEFFRSALGAQPSAIG
jgi:hypothetical protein